MTYVMSDIHGNYSAFQKMLKQINFTDDDLLYIAGDLVDYGADSMELLCDISMRANVYSVVGDHDLEALKMLAGFSKMLESGAAPDAEFAAAMKEDATVEELEAIAEAKAEASRKDNEAAAEKARLEAEEKARAEAEASFNAENADFPSTTDNDDSRQS